ncbi:MAG: hypothetical protein ABEK03_08950 [Candidatus Bipolaricaulia bacterium]
MILAPLVLSVAAAWLALALLVPRLTASGLTGRDLHKPEQPDIAEMGGLGIVAGFVPGVLGAVALDTFLEGLVRVETVTLLAVLATVLIVALVGVLDDLLDISQSTKAVLPLLAAFPLVAIEAGQTTLAVPFLGRIDFGIAYALVLVPLGVTGAANAANMLAGFNGLEVGLGLVATGSLAIIAAAIGATTALVILLAGVGALVGALRFNWLPARVMIGDVGTLSIGAIVAAAVIVGNFETAGVVVILPYAIDFLLKAASGFPSTDWWGELRGDGALHCPRTIPVSFPQLVMKLAGGVHERALVLALMGVEAVFGALAIGLYVL